MQRLFRIATQQQQCRMYAVARSSIESRVISTVQRFNAAIGRSGTPVSPESHFFSDLQVPLLYHPQLLLALEAEFVAAIPEKEFQSIMSVADAVDYFQAHPQTK
eukprot:NODE_6235_length_591_cov_39.217712_g5825_i0.p1 GENE.NODE_6235_length_591_cov_39.217712_g5825_i0~~NODE_6235_length_591_cov_39.217712_g5825_i0.p1  ORF type:complete len:104 (-),score=13.91 NODE_6235_length_591_cov_39.217712_g5825_i0:185-496(-)